MQAVFELGGKQYRAAVGQEVNVDKMPHNVGDRVEIARVLMVLDEGQMRVGKPFVEGAKVLATVVEHGKLRKIIVFKYKTRNRYRQKLGHRPRYSRLRIDDIILE
ncbi:MAG: 50S ribosomal protein L21 [Anaerolineae bacterium]